MPEGAIAEPLKSKPLPHFLFTEECLLHFSTAMTRDELCVYLLILSGYAPRTGESKYGAKGARDRLGMARPVFLTARDRLERKGVIHVIDAATKHPRTVIASLARPFGQEETEFADQHIYSDLNEEGPLIALPMKLIYGDEAVPEARLESLSMLGSIRLLLWCYGRCRDDGYIRSDLMWASMKGGKSVLKMSPKLLTEYRLDDDDVEQAGAELFDSELLIPSGEADDKGRGKMWLRFVVESPESGTGIHK